MPGGVTVRVVVTIAPNVAVILATTEADGVPEVVATNVVEVPPAGMVTNEGTVTNGLLLLSDMPSPKVAGRLNVIVPREVCPADIVVGVIVTVETATFGVPQMPATAPPSHVSPVRHPQFSVPPQPSGMGPHVPSGAKAQTLRTQPAVTVRGLVRGISPAAPEVAEMVTVF
jgi:hypothetical protein